MSIFSHLVRRRSPSTKTRRGVATVEFAVCMPVIIVIVFASIEACGMVFLKIDLQTVAYEAARVAATPSGTSTDATNRGNEVLTQRNVQGGSVQISPASLQAVQPGGWVTVTATAPTASNRIISSWFFNAGNLSAATVMVKEGTSVH